MTPTDKKLYELFSDKTLSEGCRVKAIMFWRDEYFTCIGMRKITEWVWIYQYDKFEQDWVPIEIIWHEPKEYNLRKVANEEWYFVEIDTKFNEITFYLIDKYKEKRNVMFCKYNPFISFIQQEEETKLSIINLFTND